MPNANNLNASGHTYGFNGMENDNEIKGNGNSLDYGGRMLDPRLGRWFAVDYYTKYYTSYSPYNFAVNSPIQAMDYDGDRVLFVNGYYNTGSLGSVAGTKGGEAYWGASMVKAAQSYFNDYDKQFIDGRGKYNSSGQERFQAGYKWAQENYNTLVEGIIDEDGVQQETFKVVTHSMGAAYAEGIIKYLEQNNLEVERVVHLSPADPSEFNASDKPKTLQLNLEDDIVLKYKNFAENDMIYGVDAFGVVETERWFGKDYKSSHADTKFKSNTFDKVRDLESVGFDRIENLEIKRGSKTIHLPQFKTNNINFGTVFLGVVKFGNAFNKIKGAKTFKSSPRFR